MKPKYTYTVTTKDKVSLTDYVSIDPEYSFASLCAYVAEHNSGMDIEEFVHFSQLEFYQFSPKNCICLLRKEV